jgi:D-alanyl-D-alanine carboxypeptidase
MKGFRAQALGIGVLVAGLAAGFAAPAHAGASILVDADSGKVLRAENATYPWYPASTTKLMTLYMALSAIRDHRITFDTLFTVSRNANAQAPTKMGFPVGTPVTVDNALKMMMVKSANDMAVLLAEGISGSVDAFAEEMTNTAHQLGMTESTFVNPNGLPADGQITSARDLAILARALIREFPEYSSYWHIPAIRFGNRVVRNYNPLLGRYPGADGMKTGFICASGFNLVATATRGNKHLIAVVLGSTSGAARAMKAAEMLESGFSQNPLAWLTPSLGTVDALVPMEAAPPNLKDEICGGRRKRPAAEDEDLDADTGGSAEAAAAMSQTRSFLLSALRAPTNPVLLSDLGSGTPVVVYTGPTRTGAQAAAPSTDDGTEPSKKKGKKKTASTTTDDQTTPEKPVARKPPAKPVAARPPAKKPTDSDAGAGLWTPMSPTSAANAGSTAPKKPTKPGVQ